MYTRVPTTYYHFYGSTVLTTFDPFEKRFKTGRVNRYAAAVPVNRRFDKYVKHTKRRRRHNQLFLLYNYIVVSRLGSDAQNVE